MKRYLKTSRDYTAIGKMKPVQHGLVDYTAEGTYDDADCEIGYTDFGNGPEATHIFIKDHYKGDKHYDAQTIELSKSVKASAELDERFSFDLNTEELEFWLDTTTADAKIFIEDEEIVGEGAGIKYTVVIAVPTQEDHWQMKEDIARNLERHITEMVDGTDYCGMTDVTESHVYPQYGIPDDVAENSVFYRATIEIIPYQNISPWGEYGIDYGTEEYLDHVTKGTPFPRED